MSNPIKFIPPIIAHRGASAYAPENTLAAFSRAAQMGMHWLEFDVMLSADKVPIIFHDDDLDRTTNGHGAVGHHTYAELQQLDAGSWFDPRFSNERIPSLAETVEFLSKNGMAANVEIKPLPGQDKSTVSRALDIILPHFSQPNPAILFSSFSVESLIYLRECLPTAYLGLLLHEWIEGWEDIAESLNCVSVHVFEEILTQESAKKIKKKQKLLLSYTVNNAERAKELYSWGVDAVFSDAPDRILS